MAATCTVTINVVIASVQMCVCVCFFVRLSVSVCVLGLVSRAFLIKTYTKKMSFGKLFEGSVMDS